MRYKNFTGKDGFVWWYGVVEDVDDPEFLGRCKVRCIGYHPSKNKNTVPTEDLPWATVLVPATEGGISGTGRSPNGIQQGAWVFGIFLDGKHSQNPLILGSLPKIETADLENIVPKQHR